MKSFISFALTLTLAFVLLKILVVLLEPKLTFFPSSRILETPKEYGIEYRELSFSTDDGETLFAWFLPNSNPKAHLLFFHGNGGNISAGCVDYLAALHRHGYSIFAFDYRGYGRSSGSPSEEGIYTDSRAAVRYFSKNFFQDGAPLVYLGHSLGGVAAACAAALQEPDGMILQGTFPDKSTLLKYYPFFYFLGFFSRYRLSTLEFLQEVSCPVLVVHGERDRVVPLGAGQALYDRIETRKQFYLVQHAGHADLHQVGGNTYWERIGEFIRHVER